MSLLVFSYFMRQHDALHLFVGGNEQIMEGYSCVGLIAADVKCADSIEDAWVEGMNEIILRTTQGFVSWRLSNNQVYRCKGNYNVLYHSWESKSTALVARNMKTLSIKTHKEQGRVIHVTIRAKNSAGSYELIVPLLNRVLA